MELRPVEDPEGLCAMTAGVVRDTGLALCAIKTSKAVMGSQSPLGSLILL